MSDLKRERRGTLEIEVAVALRKSDDEAVATADLMATMLDEFLGSIRNVQTSEHVGAQKKAPIAWSFLVS